MNLIVEVAFEKDVWTDISDRLSAHSSKRGKQRFMDVFQPGESVLTIENADAAFSPHNTESPFWPHVRPRRPIRLLLEHDGVKYPLWWGLVRRWPPTWDGAFGEVQITAAEDTSRLARVRLAGSPWEYEVRRPLHLTEDETQAGVVTHWYRLSETRRAVAADAAGAAHGEYVNDATENSVDGLIAADPDTAIAFDATEQQWVIIPRAGAITSHSFMLVCHLQTTQSPSSLASIYFAEHPAGFHGGRIHWYMLPDGRIRFGFWQHGNEIVATSDTPVNDGQPHTISAALIQWEDSGTDWVISELTTDGVFDGTAFTSDVVFEPFSEPATLFGLRHGWWFDGTADDVVIIEWPDFGPSPAFISGSLEAHASRLSDAARTAWGGDLSGARIRRILEAARIPEDRWEIDDGQTELQGVPLEPALSYIDKAAHTELGGFYQLPDGRYRFRDRHQILNQTPKLVFSDDGDWDTIPYHVPSLKPEHTDERLATEVQVSRQGGPTHTIVDDEAVDEFGLLTLADTGLWMTTDIEARARMFYLLHRHREPITIIRDLVLHLHAMPEWVDKIMELELEDVVQVRYHPWEGTPLIQDSLVLGIDDSSDSGGFERRLWLSPLDTTRYFEWDRAGYGWDQEASWAY